MTAGPRVLGQGPGVGAGGPAAEAESLVVTASPHIASGASTLTIMWSVVASLVPIVIASIWFFGPSAALVEGAAVAGAMLTEKWLGKGGTLRDGSALITGLLLGLTLPPGIAMWMAFVGGAFAIAFGKLIFGGLGLNPFNPALLARAFLQAAFPTALTTWSRTDVSWWTLRGDNFAVPFMHPKTVDALTAATPLGLMKFEQKGTALWNLAIGSTNGSLGETAGVLILLCGAWLAWKRFLDWRIPVGIMATVAGFAALLQAFGGARYPSPLFMLFSGGLMLGAVFMATDPVTAPVTKPGRWIFSIAIGVMVVIVRVWGGLPEGVMYAILLFNALTPFINRITRPRVFGTGRAVRVRVTT